LTQKQHTLVLIFNRQKNVKTWNTIFNTLSCGVIVTIVVRYSYITTPFAVLNYGIGILGCIQSQTVAKRIVAVNYWFSDIK